MEEEDEKGGKNTTAILQIDIHCSCEGCSDKVFKCIHDLHELNSMMKIEENGAVYKVTVTGKFDPLKLRQKMEKKLKKTVKLKVDKEETEIEQKHKCYELPLTTAVFKMPLNCDACNEKIHQIITQNGGCRNMKMDWENNLVTVTGTIDVKSLAESLRYHLRKDVEILTVSDGGVYLSCADSSPSILHPCQILQKYTTFGESNTYPLTFLKSSNNIGVYRSEFESIYPRSTRSRSMTGDYLYHATEVFNDENPNACTIL